MLSQRRFPGLARRPGSTAKYVSWLGFRPRFVYGPIVILNIVKDLEILRYTQDDKNFLLSTFNFILTP